MDYQSPLSKARGLGSAKDGLSHWWLQRLTAIALVPLCFWFCFGVAQLPSFDYAEFSAWLSGPFNASLMIAVLLVGFYHGALGMQVVLEDYVSNKSLRTVLIISVQGSAAFLALIGVVSVLMILFGD